MQVLISKWLTQMDGQMRREDRRILLVMYNCSAHIINACSMNVYLEFLLPNNMSLLQPWNQGIIKCVMVELRKHLVQQITDRTLTRTSNSNQCPPGCRTSRSVVENTSLHHYQLLEVSRPCEISFKQ